MISFNKKKIVRSITQISIVIIGFLTFSSCSFFQSTQRADLSPYAENIIKLSGNINYGLTQAEAIHIREYLDGPKVKSLKEYGKKTRSMMRGIIAYSIEIVTLGNTKMKDSKRSQKLADYLANLLHPILAKPNSRLDFASAELDTVLKNVRKQKNFLDGLNASQPLLDNIAATFDDFLDETQIILDEALEEINNRIMDDNRIMIVGSKNLRDFQFRTMYNIEYFQKYRMGDSTALDSLFSKEPSLKEVVKDQNNITSSDLAAMENMLIFRLKTLHDLREQLSVDVELYKNQIHELDQHTKLYNEAIKKIRIVVIVWSEAHRKLAAGITDPAKIDIVGMVVNAAANVVAK